MHFLLYYDNHGTDMKKVNVAKTIKTTSAKTPKRVNTSIKFDTINPSDYMRYTLRFSCEDCTHFDLPAERCTLGYVTSWHRKEFQEKSYELTGKMALCRFQEID